MFADAENRTPARRWTNRQSGHPAVRADTGSVLIVAEALHDGASSDVERLMSTVADEVGAVWSVAARPLILSESSPRVDFNYGYCASRYSWGRKLYLVTALEGMPIVWCLADPELGEREVAADLLGHAHDGSSRSSTPLSDSSLSKTTAPAPPPGSSPAFCRRVVV